MLSRQCCMGYNEQIEGPSSEVRHCQRLDIVRPTLDIAFNWRQYTNLFIYIGLKI